MRKKYKLGNRPLTFAEASKKLSREAEERPNDPISRRGLDASMQNLLMMQEAIRAKKQAGQEGLRYAHGGRLANHLAGDAVSQYLTGNFDSPQPQHTYWGYVNVDQNLNNVQVPLAPTTPAKAQDYTFKSFWDAANESGYKGLPEGPLWEGAQAVMGENYRNPSAPVYKDREGLPDYDMSEVTVTPKAKAESTSEGEDNVKLAPTWLRYAPVLGASIGLAQNLLSKPDYTASERVLKAAEGAGQYDRVKFNPIGDYLTYRPLDRQYAINLLNAQSGATRRNIMNTSGGNRGQAMAGLLAADYSAGNQLGNLFRQAEESNQAQRERVATFNRGTNQYNSEGDLKAQIANQQARQAASRLHLAGIEQAMQLRNAVDAQRGASFSANMTNLFNSLGDIGKENATRNMVNTNPALYYSIGADNDISYKNGYDDLSEAEKKQVRTAAKKAAKKKAKGGYLTIKKGGRYA